MYLLTELEHILIVVHHLQFLWKYYVEQFEIYCPSNVINQFTFTIGNYWQPQFPAGHFQLQILSLRQGVQGAHIGSRYTFQLRMYNWPWIYSG